MARFTTPFWVLELHSNDNTKLDLSVLDTEHKVDVIIEEIFETREDILSITIFGTSDKLKRKEVNRAGEEVNYLYCNYYDERNESLCKQLFDQMVVCGFDQEGQLVL